MFHQHGRPCWNPYAVRLFSRGIHRVGSSVRSGSVIRGCSRPILGYWVKREMASSKKSSSRNHESSSRKHRNSPETRGTPALRPAGIPILDLQEVATHAFRQPCGIPAVSDDHHVKGDVSLAQEAFQGPVQFSWPVPHGQDDNTNGGQVSRSASFVDHRNLDEAILATKWPMLTKNTAGSRIQIIHFSAMPGVPTISETIDMSRINRLSSTA